MIRRIVLAVACILVTNLSAAQYYKWAAESSFRTGGDRLVTFGQEHAPWVTAQYPVIVGDNDGSIYYMYNGRTPFVYDDKQENFNNSNLNSFIIHKRSIDGTTQWVRAGLEAPYDRIVFPLDATSDKDGNLYVVGAFTDTVVVNGETFTTGKADEKAFVARFDTSGSVIWFQSYTLSDIHDSLSFSYRGEQIAYDSSGRIYAAGSVRRNDASATWTWIKALTPGGNEIWEQLFADSNMITESISVTSNHLSKIATGNDGSVYLTGSFGSIFPSADTTFTTHLFRSTFLVKLDSSGSEFWAKAFVYGNTDPVNGNRGSGLATDKAGNVYIAGDFQRQIDIDGNWNSQIARSLYLACFSPTGKLRWARTEGSIGPGNFWDIEGVHVRDMVINDNGQLYVTGFVRGQAWFGELRNGKWVEDTVTSALGGNNENGQPGMFLAQYDTSGIYNWVVSAPNAYGRRLIAGTDHNVFVTGHLGRTASNPSLGDTSHYLRFGDHILQLDSANSIRNYFTAKVKECVNPDTLIRAPLTGLCPGSGDSLRISLVDSFENIHWSNGSTQQYIYVDTPGTYHVAIHTNPWCAFRDTVVIDTFSGNHNPQYFVNDEPLAGRLLICKNDSLILSADTTELNNFHWLQSGNPTLTINVAGTYEWIATDSNNCHTGGTLTTEPNLYLSNLIISHPNTVICPNDSVKLEVTSGDFGSFHWEFSQEAMLYATSPGTYNWTATDTSGCPFDGSFTLHPTPFPQDPESQSSHPIDADTALICQGQTFEIGFRHNYSVYNWSHDETTSDLSLTHPGHYSVELTDSNGCSSTFSFFLRVIPLPGDSIVLHQDTLFVADGYEHYQWYLENEPLQGANQHWLVPEENGNYHVSTINRYGCQGTTSKRNVSFVSMDKTATGGTIHIYPNPFDHRMHIRFDQSVESVSISLVNALGQVMYHKYTERVESQQTLQIKTDLPPGFYHLYIQTGRETVVFPVVKN